MSRIHDEIIATLNAPAWQEALARLPEEEARRFSVVMSRVFEGQPVVPEFDALQEAQAQGQQQSGFPPILTWEEFKTADAGTLQKLAEYEKYFGERMAERNAAATAAQLQAEVDQAQQRFRENFERNNQQLQERSQNRSTLMQLMVKRYLGEDLCPTPTPNNPQAGPSS